MPSAPPRRCPRCPKMQPCPDHHGKRSPRAEAYHGLYDRRWQRYRLAFLMENPLCAECEREGRITPATVIDHVDPHKGDLEKFWSAENHQALCVAHHNRKTALQDGGFGKQERQGGGKA